ncbi:MAG: guanylate cyclase [Spirochaetes bacterium GWD1_61_31]|nr:MAG: guanylate cyclase [Spirochaetes bacterium GWB1_60_80]OHD34901.1 MAG: guanylate cyclase [Spirochaetes bacterium GWC1_61_12]OHD37070.1 MAG: guanylate cyclase [Spirochaetes bacterium GWD1_61_31]OHD44665.1 MAG: guanylate cyclase [Spirochaetes bacterium GWE1_60_18]OHD61072.1 MAG: guanylate cyclase [Spirochaetes bacterium GWF1_60_12]HAP42732.1 adenylate/guanylate cyclase domain-containing protein [Spirochaetaceae bacterium]
MKKLKTGIKLGKRLILIPLITGLLFASLYLVPGWQAIEYRIYDFFLGLKPAVVEDPNLVLLNIDENTIVNTGAWPLPRGLIARGLEVLAEVDARYVVFDIEYLENSPMSADRQYLEGALQSEFQTAFGLIASDFAELFNSLNNGMLSLEDANQYAEWLVDSVNQTQTDLYGKTGRVAVENDSYLGQAMRLFGNAYSTLNMQKEDTANVYPERQQLARQRFAYQKIENRGMSPSEFAGFLVPIPEISSLAKNAGFTNVYIDPDGVRRRIRLVDIIEDQYYLQLATAPLIDWMGNPAIVLDRRQITLKGVNWAGRVQDLRIPLDANGMMLIRWPKTDFDHSFRSVSFFDLLEYRNAEDSLFSDLRKLRTNQVWGWGIGLSAIDSCITAYSAMDEARLVALASGVAEDRAAWLELKDSFRQSLADFLAIGYGTGIPQQLAELAATQADPATAEIVRSTSAEFSVLYDRVEEQVTFLQTRLAELKTKLAGSFNVIGWSGTGTTDIGVNPFFEKYVNIGTHTAVVNTIIQQDFLQEAPLWFSGLLSLALAFGIVLVISRLQMNLQIVVGIAATVAVLVGIYLVFHFTGVYIALLSPGLATFIAFLAYTLISFLISEREKSFLRKAFSTYLSGDIINELVNDPAMLKLGGQSKYITAMFTDVRGFSTISEAISPEQLVDLLNLYLSGMSDIILERQGTIDKYEGDAIIAFFGAPLTDEKHAYKACVSALRMKQIEASLNERFMADKMTPNPLVTRIGLNTGDMVVGNMGTKKKMNYTIMGNAVNLAARLEGVNKQYGSWILATDATLQAAGPDVVARALDRVRVVGIHTPVQLWEVMALRAEADRAMTELLSGFAAAHELFEARQYPKSEAAFQELVAAYPNDGPSTTYLKRSQNFQQKPPADNWDGVFNLTEK